MKVKMQVKMIDRTLLVHFIEGKPNLRGRERFSLFVERLERVLGIDLRGVRVILTPLPLKGGETIEINWSRFDAEGWKLKDFIAT